MFDIGWSELLVLGAIALIVVGPKDLPGMLRTLGKTVGQAKRMAREFQNSMEDAAREVDIAKDMKDVQSSMRDVQTSMADWNKKIGADAPRKYAERMMNGEDGDAPARVDPSPDASPSQPGAAPASPAPVRPEAAAPAASSNAEAPAAAPTLRSEGQGEAEAPRTPPSAAQG